MIFKAPPQFGKCSMSKSNTRLSQARPTHARSIILALGHPATVRMAAPGVTARPIKPTRDLAIRSGATASRTRPA